MFTTLHTSFALPAHRSEAGKSLSGCQQVAARTVGTQLCLHVPTRSTRPFTCTSAAVLSPDRSTATSDRPQAQPVTGPSAWTRADYQERPDQWTLHLSPTDIQELQAAVAAVRASGKDIMDTTSADFNLPSVQAKLLQLKDEVVHGRGFALIKGLPVQEWGVQDSVIAYWGLGSYLGPAVSQNAKRHLVGHVKDIDLPGGFQDPVNRIYATRGAQPYHTDPSDVVGLLCLKQAEWGGLSSWASSVAVHNAMLERHPDLAAVMAEPWYIDRKNEVPKGKLPYFAMPLFNYHQGRLIVYYENGFIQSAQRHEDVPRLSSEQLRAIEVFDGLASSDEFRMDYVLQPGDIQLLHNHQIVHTRSEYRDSEEREKRRHLLRLWVSPKDGWALPDVFAERFAGDTMTPGARGGIHVEGYEPCVPLEAC